MAGRRIRSAPAILISIVYYSSYLRNQIRHTLRIVHAKALQRQPVFEEIAAQNRVANRDHRINVRRWHPDNLARFDHSTSPSEISSVK